MSEQEWPIWLPLRSDLRNLSPYGAPQLPSLARLNTNENPYPPSEEFIKAIVRRVEEVSRSLNRYPDRDSVELRKALANFLNSRSHTTLSEHNIWAANGSNEIIQSIFLAFGGETTIGFTPSYSMHPLIAQVTSTPWVSGVRKPDFTLDSEVAMNQIRTTNAKLIFLTTPNNPTGTAISLSDIEKLAKAAAQIAGLLVVDEAYAEFSDQPSAVTLLKDYPNLLVIRTMSKAFALAGARLGYLAANEAVVNALQLVRLPYHLGAITQGVALIALEHSDELLANVAKLVAERERMVTKLKSLDIDVIPSSANFLLFTVPSSKEIWRSLLDQGVLVRDVGIPGYLRVTIGSASENQLFIDALANSLGKSLGGEL